MNAPTNKRIFPKLWTALGSPKDNSTRLKRKGKGKSQVYDGYFDLPLDGEEGELVDDEACFVDIPKTIGTCHRLSFLIIPTIVRRYLVKCAS